MSNENNSKTGADVVHPAQSNAVAPAGNEVDATASGNDAVRAVQENDAGDDDDDADNDDNSSGTADESDTEEVPLEDDRALDEEVSRNTAPDGSAVWMSGPQSGSSTLWQDRYNEAQARIQAFTDNGDDSIEGRTRARMGLLTTNYKRGWEAELKYQGAPVAEGEEVHPDMITQDMLDPADEANWDEDDNKEGKEGEEDKEDDDDEEEGEGEEAEED